MTEDTINWLQFLQPYELAVNGFVMKLESIKKQYILAGERSPIESVSGRVKTPKSILAKLKRMNMNFDEIRNLSDIGGIRITCKYIQEVRLMKLLETNLISIQTLRTVQKLSHLQNVKVLMKRL